VLVHKPADAAQGGLAYCNEFTCILAGVPFRPRRQTPRPVVGGPQTAVVTGPSGEEIHTDKYGRIKVQFHWDREGKQDDKTSSWVRVAQATAGAGFGSVFLPRIGWEVVVTFLEGDPDQPLVTGCVYNAQTMPPYALPANKTRTLIKTQSTPGGGGWNELRFEDKKGHEEVFLHAQKDLNEVVLHDHSTQVTSNQSDSVGADQSITVGKNRTKNVSKDEKTTIGQDRTENVAKNETVAIGINRSHAIGSNDSLAVGANQRTDVAQEQHVAVGSNRVVQVRADDVLEVGGDKKQTVGANFAVTVKTKYQLQQGGTTFKLDGGKTLLQGGDAIEITHGSGKIEIAASGKVTVVGGPAVELQSGGCTVKLSSGAVEITAPTQIKLGVGSSGIEIGPAGVTTSGPKLSSAATGINEITGALVKIN
jgi:type VI secretion system secreted protein VgrG